MSRTRPNRFYYNDLHLFGVSMIFTDIKNYQSLIEDFLESQKAKLEAEFNETDIVIESKKAGKFHQEYHEHLLNSYIDRHRELGELFPHNFRAFFLTQVIAIIEAEFKKLTNGYGEFKNQSFSVDDLGGTDDLEKCKKYLNSITQIDFSEFEPEWQFVKNCKILRNKIVHQEGFVKISDTKLMGFINEVSSLEFDEQRENQKEVKIKIINKQLIDKLLSSGEELIEKLIDRLDYSS